MNIGDDLCGLDRRNVFHDGHNCTHFAQDPIELAGFIATICSILWILYVVGDTGGLKRFGIDVSKVHRGVHDKYWVVRCERVKILGR